MKLPQPVERQVSSITERIDSARIKSHLQVLCYDIGPREPGSTQEWQAASYISDQLKQMGLSPSTDTCNHRGWAFHNTRVTIIQSGDREIPSGWLVGSPATAPNGVEADVVDGGDGSDESYGQVDVRDKIVLVKRSVGTSPGRYETIRRAAGNGAIGYLEYSTVVPEDLCQVGNTIGNRWTLHEDYARLPCATITHRDAFALLTSLRNGGAHIRLTVGGYDGVPVWRRSPNVHAQLAGSEPEEHAVVIVAHLDSHTPGAHDNASGVSYMLELARQLVQSEQLRPVLLLFPGAEQFGLRGSTAFVRDRPDIVTQTLAVVDYGAIGDGDALWVDRTPDLARCASAAIKLVRPLADCSVVEQPPAVASDHAPFVWLAGVPGIEIHYREFRYLFTSHDTPDRISLERVLYAGHIGAAFVALLANSPVFPLHISDYARAVKERLHDSFPKDHKDAGVLAFCEDLERLERLASDTEGLLRASAHVPARRRSLNHALRTAVVEMNMKMVGEFTLVPRLRSLLEDIGRIQSSKALLSAVASRRTPMSALGVERILDETLAKLHDEIQSLRSAVARAQGILSQVVA